MHIVLTMRDSVLWTLATNIKYCGQKQIVGAC